MRFLPLIPSAHPSAWTVEPDEMGREETCHTIFERDDHTCQFCGYRAVGWQEVFHLDGDHDNWSADNLVTSCMLCHGSQHLGRTTVEQEYILIWLPEITQAALNAVVRRIHLVLHSHNEPVHMGEPSRSDHPAVRRAVLAYTVLAGEARTLEARIHSASPRALGAALLSISPTARERPARILGGIRLLHRGRHFRQGRDIYPQILSAWATNHPPARA